MCLETVSRNPICSEIQEDLGDRICIALIRTGAEEDWQ
jgi:hypothetical protein